jgi:hypothetical protein
LITYENIARVRREVENILLLVDELEDRGIPKGVIVNIILNESEKPSNKDECSSKDK